MSEKMSQGKLDPGVTLNREGLRRIKSCSATPGTVAGPTTLLMHRKGREDQRCRRKIGKGWFVKEIGVMERNCERFIKPASEPK
jgi:hypothetical protein